MKRRLWGAAAIAVVLTACSSGSGPGTSTTNPSSSTAPSSTTPSSISSSPAGSSGSVTTPPTGTLSGRSAAAWRRLVDAAALTTSDLTPGFRSTAPTEPDGQTECPSLDAVSASRTHDVAYRRVSFELSANGPFVDEVIAVNPDPGSVVDQFATTATACARFQSTASNGDVISYQASAQTVTAVGDRTVAVWVDGRTKNATGTYHAGEGVFVFERGAVVVQVSSAGVPPPLRELSPTIAALAYRKLVRLLSER